MANTEQSKDLRAELAARLQAGDASSVLSLFDALLDKHGALAAEHDALAQQHGALAQQHAALASEVQSLDQAVKHLRRLLYGRSSEKLTAEELGQLVLAYGGSLEQAGGAEPRMPVPERSDGEPDEQPRHEPSKKRKHPGRTKLSPDLERRVTDVPVPEDDRSCMQCGKEMACIGHLEHERVTYVPAKFVVLVERRETLACKLCRGDAVTADRVSMPAGITRVDASVLAHLLESKCDDALPIHRQCDQFARLGFEIPVDTLYGYWRYATGLLEPISDALLGTILADPVYVGIDDTGIDVLDKTRKGGKFRGHFWCFRGSRPLVAYAFTETWRADEIEPWIHAIPPDVFIQVDDYKGYSSERRDPVGVLGPLVPAERRLGCMMHVRRRFHEAFKLGDKRAAFAVEQIRRIYDLEESARSLAPDARLAMRQQQSIPILDTFDAWVDEQHAKLGNTGKHTEAVRYARAQRSFVRRCFTDGRFEIDNGRVERAIREPALGRKNFLFSGSPRAAARLAGAYSLVQTCRALGISTREYLIDVIEKIEAGHPMRQLVELLPHRWAADRGLAVAET